MTAIVSNYVSPEDLTLWLAEKQNDIYADMRSAIDMSNERSQMQTELGTIKQHLEEANARGDFELVREEIVAFLDTHAESPEFGQVSGPLVEIRTSIDEFYAAKEEEAELEVPDLPNDNDVPMMPSLPDIGDIPLHYAAEQLKSWTDAIGSKVDFLGRQDQLAMIQIQELNGKVNQSEQLVSNLIASQNQTQNAVISNIRG